jgi:hypothetical protein
MIVGIKQAQRKGKGIVGAAIMLWLMAYGGYGPDDCCGNQSLFIPGTHALIPGYRTYHNTELLYIMQVMVSKHVRGKALWISEADRAFPPRFWHDSAQTRALIGLQQDEKMGNWFIWDAHWRGVDVLLQESTQIEIIPDYKAGNDFVDLEIIRLFDLVPAVSCRVENLHESIFPYYDTYEPVD